MQIPRRKSEELRQRDEGPIYLTEQGIKRLKGELEHLKRVLPERIQETARTAAFGDRSDNAEYKAAKSLLRGTHYRILTVEEQLKRAVVIKRGGTASGLIRLGSAVVLESNGIRKEYEILGSQETDPGRGRISHVSPLGAALMNRKKGDTVSVTTRSGTREYRILEIR